MAITPAKLIDSDDTHNHGISSEPITPTGTLAAKANALVNIDTASIDKIGVFTTAQSLATFPGAVAAVTTIWIVLGRIRPSLGKDNAIVPIALSLAMGMFIYLMSVSRGSSWKEKMSGFGIAIVNSFTIAAAALGINPSNP